MLSKYNQLEKKFSIGNVEIGGLYGEIPSVLIGSIFYMRHKIVQDPKRGIFNEAEAETLVKNCEDLASKLGISFMLDVVGDTAEALIKYMEFLYNITDVPLLLNSTLPETRIKALEFLAKRNILNRVVYNSINAFSTEEELSVLKDIPLKAVVIQAYNLKSKKPDGPLKALYGNNEREGLLDMALDCGITKLMIDIPTLDLASVGVVSRSLKIIQEELGIPVGTAPSNASYASEWMRNRKNLTKEQFRATDAAINAYLASNGSNFLFYGPIEGYEWVFPATAVVNAMNVYGMKNEGVRPETEFHPFFKIL